jgi:hypothetical protein
MLLRWEFVAYFLYFSVALAGNLMDGWVAWLDEIGSSRKGPALWIGKAVEAL